jgi:hypothetical protein
MARDLASGLSSNFVGSNWSSTLLSTLFLVLTVPKRLDAEPASPLREMLPLTYLILMDYIHKVITCSAVCSTLDPSNQNLHARPSPVDGGSCYDHVLISL